jgi:hypothetical protein
MTLSERIAAGEASTELDAAIAKAMGWAKVADVSEAYDEWWAREGSSLSRDGCPCYRTDIRLTIAEIERRDWPSRHENHIDAVHGRNLCAFHIFNGDEIHKATRTDLNLTLAALEALLKAMGE